jgi:UDP-glucose 4-epimerase
MLRQSIRGGTIIVHGSGAQTRDYVFVDDVVNAMVAASTAPGINNLVINVGSGVETSVRELVNIVQQAAGNQAEVVYNPRMDPGVSRMCADLKLAADKLNYQPRIAIPEGLRLTMQRDPRLRKDATRPIKQSSNEA